MYFEVIFVDNA